MLLADGGGKWRVLFGVIFGEDVFLIKMNKN
jgi:hypothetical protein